MLLLDGGFGLVLLGLWIFCIIDVITTEETLSKSFSVRSVETSIGVASRKTPRPRRSV